jgi:hypothetical protein
MSRAAGYELEDDGLALAMDVRAETGGNPFFVGEVLRHLAEPGAIVFADGRWRPARLGEDRLLPEGIRDVIGRRVSAPLSRLSKRWRRRQSSGSDRHSSPSRAWTSAPADHEQRDSWRRCDSTSLALRSHCSCHLPW